MLELHLLKVRNTKYFEQVKCQRHSTKDEEWREKMKTVFDAGEQQGCNVTTFAGYLGKEDDLLEARRKEFWGKDKQKG